MEPSKVGIFLLDVAPRGSFISVERSGSGLVSLLPGHRYPFSHRFLLHSHRSPSLFPSARHSPSLPARAILLGAGNWQLTPKPKLPHPTPCCPGRLPHLLRYRSSQRGAWERDGAQTPGSWRAKQHAAALLPPVPGRRSVRGGPRWHLGGRSCPGNWPPPRAAAPSLGLGLPVDSDSSWLVFVAAIARFVVALFLLCSDLSLLGCLLLWFSSGTGFSLIQSMGNTVQHRAINSSVCLTPSGITTRASNQQEQGGCGVPGGQQKHLRSSCA
ncbi:uncharacterized protein LOC120640118 [Panicum virgatum]|uniref:uncharacterized protein LOC120640118 n=1 Tax=Panicum virgatum TaxID=38727 RepID=UPI0019D5EC91|nr:uncharacterized protein LOC120640118 [Panicum virgatum]